MAEQAQLSRIPDLAAVGNAYPFLRYTELTRDALPFLKDAIAGTRTVKEGVHEAARVANQTLSAAAKG